MSATKTRSEAGTREQVTRSVVLKGVTPIMFDRYPGDNDTKLSPSQKMYYSTDGHSLVLPSTNLTSFLSAKNTDSAPKRLLDPRKYKKFTEACAAYTMIQAPGDAYSEDLPFTRDGKPIVFDAFGPDEVCQSSGVFIKRDTARLKDGVPNPKVRPILPLPWSLHFVLHIYPNNQLQEQQIHNLFVDGGIAVGLGTWRGRFGKFVVETWE